MWLYLRASSNILGSSNIKIIFIIYQEQLLFM